MEKYVLYELLLVLNALVSILTNETGFLTAFGHIVGFFILLAGVSLDIYWELFWANHHSSQKTIATTGPYLYVRHPLLSSFLLISFGMAVAFNSIISFFIAVLTLITFMIGTRNEEQLLLKKHNTEYSLYMKKVPCRLVPYLI